MKHKKVIITTIILIIFAIIMLILFINQKTKENTGNEILKKLNNNIDDISNYYLGNSNNNCIEGEKAIEFGKQYIKISDFSFKKAYNSHNEESIFFDIPKIKNNSNLSIKGILAIITFYDNNNQPITQTQLELLDRVNDMPLNPNMTCENEIGIIGGHIALVNDINVNKYDLEISKIYL